MADVNGKIMVSSTVDFDTLNAMFEAEATVYEAMEAIALAEGITVDQAYQNLSSERED